MKKLIYPLFLFVALIAFVSCQPEPDAGFTVSKNDVVTGELVTFSNTTTDGFSYEWEFGDGMTSDDEDPSHAYTEAGTYSVTMTAFSKNEKKTDEASDVINVTRSNEIIYDGTKTPIVNGILINLDPGIFGVYLFGEGLDCSFNSGNWTGSGPFVLGLFLSSSSSSLVTGSYSYDATHDGLIIPNYNADSDTGTEYYVTSATADVVNEGGSYILEYSWTLDNGNTVEVYYEGALEIASKSAISLKPRLSR